tara:strand:+ start:218 stop:358 length:141 start_codon:yes stop_codon:yes gene_type:complete
MTRSLPYTCYTHLQLNDYVQLDENYLIEQIGTGSAGQEPSSAFLNQ